MVQTTGDKQLSNKQGVVYSGPGWLKTRAGSGEQGAENKNPGVRGAELRAQGKQGAGYNNEK